MGFTKLHGLAAAGYNQELCVHLKSDRTLVAEEDDWGFTPLHHASTNGSLPCVEAILSATADINAVDRFGHSSLYVACQNGNLEVARFLLSQSADPALRIVTGSTPLHAAAGSNKHSTEILRLLAAGPVPHPALDGHGNSPLHVASKRGIAASARLLASIGFDPDAANLFGESPLGLAPDEATRRAMSEGWADYEQLEPHSPRQA
jgi:ankyrin repeat protein